MMGSPPQVVLGQFGKPCSRVPFFILRYLGIDGGGQDVPFELGKSSP